MLHLLGVPHLRTRNVQQVEKQPRHASTVQMSLSYTKFEANLDFLFYPLDFCFKSACAVGKGKFIVVFFFFFNL